MCEVHGPASYVQMYTIPNTTSHSLGGNQDTETMLSTRLLVLALLPLCTEAFAPGTLSRLGTRPGSVRACRNAERGLRLRASSKTPEENKKVVSFTPAGDDGKARGISFSDSGDYTTEASQIDGDISKGKSELEQVKALTDDEAEKLREKLSKQIDKAMLEEQAKILEAYDAKTQGLLDEMKAQRDIIREENEKLQALAEEVQGGKFWKGKAKKKTNMTLTIATFLAYTFAFASVNEIYKGVAGDGLTFVGGLKAVVDLFLAVASTYIANKGPQKMLDEENEAREAAEAEAERLKKLNNGGQTNNNIDDGNPTIIDGYPVSKKPLDGFK